MFHFTALEEWIVTKGEDGNPRVQQFRKDGTLVEDELAAANVQHSHPNKEILGKPQRVHTAFGTQKFLEFLKSLTGNAKLSLHEVYDAYIEVLNSTDDATLRALGVGRVVISEIHVYYIILTGEVVSIILFEHMPCLSYGVMKYRFPHFGMSSCPLADKAHIWPATVGCGSDKIILNFDSHVPALRFLFEIIIESLNEGATKGTLRLPKIANHRPKSPSDMPPDTDTVENILKSLGATPLVTIRAPATLDCVHPPKPKQARNAKKRKLDQVSASNDSSVRTKSRRTASSRTAPTRPRRNAANAALQALLEEDTDDDQCSYDSQATENNDKEEDPQSDSSEFVCDNRDENDSDDDDSELED